MSGGTVLLGLLVLAVVLLAGKNGRKTAQLEALKAELKKQTEEQKRVQKITSSVCNMDDAVVRQRLRDVARKQP